MIAALFIAFSFIIDNYWSGNSSLKAVRNNIEKHIHEQERDFNTLVADTAFLNKLNKGQVDEKSLLMLTGKDYFIYRYLISDAGQNQLVFWNSQAVLPSETLLRSQQNEGFTRLPNGYYAWRKFHGMRSVCIALMPVKWQYVITDEYLENSFTAGPDIARNYDISLQSGEEAVRSASGNILFYLVKKVANPIAHNNLLAAWLRIAGMILILLFVHLCAGFIAVNNRLWKSVVFLLFLIIGLRLISYEFPFPLQFRQFELFDPAVYGSNMVLRSLGDLLINVTLFVWIVLFIRHRVQEKDFSLQIGNKTFSTLLPVVIAGLQLTVTFVAGNIIRSLVADSQISFDVINFFTLNRYSVIGFVVLCCLALGFFYLSQLFLFLVKPLLNGKLTAYYLFVAIGGLVYLTYRLNSGS
ncbi:MAG: hypothetical protein IPI66_15540, partial [Chitinophagaceae bacterium]|nr:hypothetical protein [Chitinophagaceae bacterium]